jgi:TRAP-type uncharacterized transport system substrate-binding protein
MDRHVFLRSMAAVFTLLAVSIAIWLYFSMPRTLRVAVGPANSEQVRFMHNVARAMIDTRQPFRLDLRINNGTIDSSHALDRRQADVAILRSDDPTSSEARSIAVLQKRSIIIVSRKDSNISSLADLHGRSAAVIAGDSDSNLPLIERILSHYEIVPEDTGVREMRPADVATAMGEGKLDAFILVIDPAARYPRRLLTDIMERLKIPLVFNGMPAAEALAFRFKDLISTEIPAGIFGGTPPRPEAAINTVAITYELVATERLSDSNATALTKTMLELRTRLRRDQDNSFNIETPPVDEQRRFLPHDGTVALVNDEAKTFLETYSDHIWLALFALSLLGSSITGFLGWSSGRVRPSDTQSFSTLLPKLTEKLATATTPSEIDAVQQEFDALVLQICTENSQAPADGQDKPDPTAWVTLFARLIESRRAGLQAQTV